MTGFFFFFFWIATSELEVFLKRFHNAEAKLQGPKDLEDQDSEKSKRKGKWSLVIVVSRRTHEMNCFHSYKPQLESVSEKTNTHGTILYEKGLKFSRTCPLKIVKVRHHSWKSGTDSLGSSLTLASLPRVGTL